MPPSTVWTDLHLTGPELFIDADVPPANAARGHSIPLAGQVGIEVAATFIYLDSQLTSVVHISLGG